MHKARGWRLLCAASGLMCFLATPALAGFGHYYYDTQGRLLGAYTTQTEQRSSRPDNADNPSYLHVFPVNPDPGADTLPVYGAMIADNTLTSADGRFVFLIGEDGNANVYENVSGGQQGLWNSNTHGKQAGWFTVGGDGNLYLNGPDDTILWSVIINGGTGTNAKLVMQSDGNLVLFQNGAAVWSTGTGGH